MNLTQKWLDIAFTPGDYSKIPALVEMLYGELGLETPEITLWKDHITNRPEEFPAPLEAITKIDPLRLPETLRAWHQATNPSNGIGPAHGYFMDLTGKPENRSRVEMIIMQMLETYKAHLIWPLENEFWIWEQPHSYSLNEEGQLHQIGAPAIVLECWDLYLYRNNLVEKHVVKEDLTLDDIRQESNADFRRHMMDRYGIDRMLEDMNGTLVDRDENYELYTLPNPVRGEWPDNLVYIKMLNYTPEADGSRRVYFYQVSPDCTNIPEAIAYFNGYDPREVEIEYVVTA